MTVDQWGFFSATPTVARVTHLLWSSSRTRDTLTWCRAFSSEAVTTCFNDLGGSNPDTCILKFISMFCDVLLYQMQVKFKISIAEIKRDCARAYLTRLWPESGNIWSDLIFAVWWLSTLNGECSANDDSLWIIHFYVVK